MEQRYVRIEAAGPISPQASSVSSGATVPKPAKRRRTGVTVACDICRRKKIRVRQPFALDTLLLMFARAFYSVDMLLTTVA